MKSIIQLLLLLLVINIMCNSCWSSQDVAKTINIESGEIPPEMSKEDFIIIGILKGKESRDKYMKSEFSKYTGNYVLCLENEMNSKYNDIEKYRYFMDFKVIENRDGAGHLINYFDRYFIYDRKERKKYERKVGSGQFKLEMRTYIAAIEAARKK